MLIRNVQSRAIILISLMRARFIVINRVNTSVCNEMSVMKKSERRKKFRKHSTTMKQSLEIFSL